MRACSQCGRRKTVEEFGTIPSRGDTAYTQCRACRNENARRDYQANKQRYFAHARAREVRLDELINAYKAKPCADCGVEYPPYVMVDHRDPEKKVSKVSTMRRRKMSFDVIVTEMEKCDVVCSNCHRERTNIQRPARYSKPGAF